MQVWQGILIAVIFLIIGLIIGYFVARKVFSNHLKKNPPINEKMIRVMYQQMGRTPSEKQVRSVMKAMNDAK